jgi:hypothetical protein
MFVLFTFFYKDLRFIDACNFSIPTTFVLATFSAAATHLMLLLRLDQQCKNQTDLGMGSGGAWLDNKGLVQYSTLHAGATLVLALGCCFWYNNKKMRCVACSRMMKEIYLLCLEKIESWGTYNFNIQHYHSSSEQSVARQN